MIKLIFFIINFQFGKIFNLLKIKKRLTIQRIKFHRIYTPQANSTPFFFNPNIPRKDTTNEAKNQEHTLTEIFPMPAKTEKLKLDKIPKI